MPGVKGADVQILQVTDTKKIGNKGKLADEIPGDFLRHTQPLLDPPVPSIAAHYRVRTSSSLTAKELFALLYSAVVSGKFDTLLISSAQSAGATDIAQCSSVTLVSPSFRSEPTKDTLSRSAMFGIVVAILCAGSILLAGLYMLAAKRGICDFT